MLILLREKEENIPYIITFNKKCYDTEGEILTTDMLIFISCISLLQLMNIISKQQPKYFMRCD